MVFVYSDKEIETLAETHDLCIGGDSIEMLQATSATVRVIPFVKVSISSNLNHLIYYF